MREKGKPSKKITSNSDGYDITIYPKYWVGVLSMAIPIVFVFVFKGMLKSLFLSLNEWFALGVFVFSYLYLCFFRCIAFRN